jgi:hypothetical protein
MSTAPRGEPESGRAFLRHTVATLAYRSRKILTDTPTDFSAFRACDALKGTHGSRTAGEILAHVCDLFDWGTALARGEHVWRDTKPQAWDADVARFFDALAGFDAALAAEAPLGSAPERLFQGPVADALTHIGQLALLRRLAGAPIRGENYFKAEIAVGRVSPDQAAPRVEF